MRTKSYTQSHLGCLVVKAVCGRYADGFQKEYETFLNHNGPEWTVARYKAIWSAALHLKEGRRDLAIQLYQKNSITYNKKTGLPKGPSRPIVSAFLEAKQPQKLRKWASVLRIYTGLRLAGPSPKQVRSLVEGITTPQTEVEKRRTHEWLTKYYVPFLVKEFLGKKIYLDLKDSYFNRLNGMKSSFAPHHIRLSGSDTVIYRYTYSIKGKVDTEVTDKLDPSISSQKGFKLLRKKEVRRMRALKNQPYAQAVLSLLSSCWAPPALDSIVPCSENRQEDMKDTSGRMDKIHYGRLGFVQEAGCKLRTVLVGNAYTQMGMAPLHSCLQRFTRQYYSTVSCEHDQVSGVSFILDSLHRGKKVWSIDLSKATDSFPLSVQTATLRMLGLPEYAQALEQIVKQPVEFRVNPWNNSNPQYRDVKYAKGQPMGLYGSFPLFHLTHILMLKSIVVCLNTVRAKAGLTPFKEDCYRILGDDMVINNGSVARTYLRILRDIGVETSPLKCFKAPVAEFAGFVVLPTNRGFTAFRPYKYPAFRQDRTVSNPTEFLYAVGAGVRQLSKSSYWEKRLQQFRHSLPLLDASLSPVITLDDEKNRLGAAVDMPWVYNLVNSIRSDPELNAKLPPSRVQSTKDLHINRKPLLLEQGFDYLGQRFDPELYCATEVPRHANAWEFSHQAFKSWSGIRKLGVFWEKSREGILTPITDEYAWLVTPRTSNGGVPATTISHTGSTFAYAEADIQNMEVRYGSTIKSCNIYDVSAPAFSQLVRQGTRRQTAKGRVHEPASRSPASGDIQPAGRLREEVRKPTRPNPKGRQPWERGR